MRHWLLSLVLLATPVCATQNDLPPPYCHVDVLPVLTHGWYFNHKELAVVFDYLRPRTVVEVGSWLGSSTIAMAKMLPDGAKLYAVDHWRGSAEHQPGSHAHKPFLPVLYQQFLSNVIHAEVTDKITPVRMDSLEAAAALDIRPDLIYIDAGHDTESVYNDLCAWYPKLAEGGVLCGDDWLFNSVRQAVERFAEENGLCIDTPTRHFWRYYRQ